MNTEQMEALQNLEKAFPKMQVGHDEDGLLVVFTNMKTDDWHILWDKYGEIIECEMTNK